MNLIQFILLLLTLHYAGFLVCKRLGITFNSFACGIFGFSGSRPADMNKIKILGLYNLSRGKDSCGIFTDGKILKGFDKTKHWPDFIQSTVLPVGTENFTVLGHTRAGTRGAATEKNAHPFLVNETLVGVHNGTISNIWSLCSKYGLKSMDYDVDSDALYHLMDKVGFPILNQYEGYAALAFTRLDDPNSLYLYHGKSKKWANSDPEEERPLFIMKTDEGLYFSSMIESLYAIRDGEWQIPVELEFNTVFKIKNGRFTKSRYKVERGNINVSTTYYGGYNGTNSHVGKKSKVPAALPPVDRTTTCESDRSSGMNSSSCSAATSSSDGSPLILREMLPLKAADPNRIYFHMGRYWYKRRVLCQGQIYLDEKGFVCSSENTKAMPYYFWSGVMLHNYVTYEKLQELAKTNVVNFLRDRQLNFAYHMSQYSRWPVGNLPNDSLGLDPRYRHIWYISQTEASGNISPRFSSRNYRFEKGSLREIRPSESSDMPLAISEHAVKNQVSSLVRNDTKTEVAPGGATNERFPEDANSTGSEGNTETRSIKPTSVRFYDITYLSSKEFYSRTSAVDMQVLKEFVRSYLIGINPLNPDQTEVQNFCMNLVDNATKNRVPIIDMLETEEDKTLLKTKYNQVYSSMLEKEIQELQFEKEVVSPTGEELDGAEEAEGVDDKAIEEYHAQITDVFTQAAEEGGESTVPFYTDPTLEEWEQEDRVPSMAETSVQTPLGKVIVSLEPSEDPGEEEHMKILHEDNIMEALENMDNISRLADELDSFDTEIGHEMAFTLYTGLTRLKESLKTIAEQQQYNVLSEKIQRHMNKESKII